MQLARLDSAAIEQVYKFVRVAAGATEGAAAAAVMREFTHFNTHFCMCTLATRNC